MKQKFSTTWKGSKLPRKQRKYTANAPLSLRRKLINANLSKELRKQHGKRSVSVKKGDKVRIMRGKFEGKEGKIISVNLKRLKVIIEGIQVKKQDGSKVNVKIEPSNLKIIELNLDDKKRISKQENKTSEKIKSEEKIEDKKNISEKKISSKQIKEKKQ